MSPSTVSSGPPTTGAWLLAADLGGLTLVFASMLLGGLGSVILIALSPTIMVDLLGFESAIVPLKNPALITLPLAFLGGFLVSKLRPEPEAAAKFEAVSHQIHVGHADED